MRCGEDKPFKTGLVTPTKETSMAPQCRQAELKGVDEGRKPDFRDILGRDGVEEIRIGERRESCRIELWPDVIRELRAKLVCSEFKSSIIGLRNF